MKNKIEKMVNEYIRLRNYPKKKRGKQFWENHSDFKILLSSLMDIKVANNSRQKCLEKLWGFAMSPEDQIFYENQKLVPPIGFCSSFIERRWTLNQQCRQVYLNKIKY